MIRVFIADDHEVVREGIRRILEDQDGLEVAGEAGTGDEVLSRLPGSDAEILLLDLSMPGPGFLETLAGVKGMAKEVRVLVLSVHPEEMWATEALKAGASGYLTKGHSGKELVAAIRRIHSGETYVTQTVGQLLIRDLTEGTSTILHTALSQRELQVLCRLGVGKAPKAIAMEFDLSPKTVSTYRARILEKLGLRNNADLIRYVIDHDLSVEESG